MMGKYVDWRELANLNKKVEEIVEVPIASGMDDETFLKHIEHRHAAECKMEKTPVHRRAMNAWVPSYRAFHERLHKIAAPGQYDHEHTED
jgi:hypothetical protein